MYQKSIIKNPSNSRNQMGVHQTGEVNSMTFLNPGEQLEVSLHANNVVTLEPGDEVAAGPGLPSAGSLS